MSDRACKGTVRLFVDAPLAAGADIVLDKAAAHHVVTVLRRTEGDRIALFNGRDGEWTAVLTAAGRKQARVTVEAQIRPQAEAHDLWFAFAPVKKARTDFLVEKATELGAGRLMPVLTQNTETRRVRTDRLSAHVREAAEQCGRLTVPEITPAITLDDMLADWPAGRGLLFCDESGKARPATAALEAFAKADKNAWAILVGPEGGFTEAERRRIRSCKGAVPISLGPRILRTETAGLAALALWQALVGDGR